MQTDIPRPAPPPAVPRTLGPVTELEQHLPADWWRKLFNALYLKTDGDVVEDRDLTRREADLILRVTGIGRGDRILDLCCGQGRHSLELARRGFKRVTGVDRSRYLVRLARRRARAEGLAVTFREGDARRFRLPENAFDAVLVLGNSFGYFNAAEDDVEVLKQVRHVLRPGGTLLLDLTDGAWMREHFQPRSWEWIDQNQLVCRERQIAGDGARLICREVVVDAEKGVVADQFYAERLYDLDTISALLTGAGFEDVRLHGRVEGESGRNQDLGMMAHRLWITTIAGAKARKGPPPPVAFPEVTVLLGDPRLPDTVKLDGRFNEQDLDTVHRLKVALEGLTDYRFRYLDDHGALLDALRTDPPAFVLNLCDEGFRNDATKELHVPAYLELHGIPYTGGGPTCLGMCYDKHLVAASATALDIPVPAETYLAPDDIGGTLPSVFPSLVKPATGDSSVGITARAVVHNTREALAHVDFLRDTLGSPGILVQEFLTGPEYSVGLIGNRGQGYTFLPVLEVDYSGLPPELPKILAYESKWDPDSPYWTAIRYREAEAPEEKLRLMCDWSARLFEHLGCRDYARIDFRCDAEGTPKLLEVNPNPGWCWDGKLNLMAEMGGQSYSELLGMILAAAERRLADGGVG